MHAERIVSIKSIGVRRCVDIEVNSKRHIFYGNGLATSNSHAISYGQTAYMCAIPKRHFPLHFFTAWLSYAGGKMKPREEIAELIQETKNFNVSVENPNISYKNQNFVLDNGKIRYGLGSIKSCGAAEVSKLLILLQDTEKRLGKSVKDFTWHELLTKVLPYSRKDVVNNLIHAGAISQHGLTRNYMLFQYNKICELNDAEIEWINKNSNCNSLYDDIENMILNKKTVAKRKEKLKNLLTSLANPPLNLDDSIDVIAKREEDVLGISLSCSRLDAKNTGFVNCTCLEFNRGEKINKVIIAVQLSRVTEWSPKGSDKKLCFLTGYDKTGKIDIMVPHQEYEKFSFLLFNGNTVAIHGSINAKSNLTAKVITQL